MINIKTLVVATIILVSYQFLETKAADQNKDNAIGTAFSKTLQNNSVFYLGEFFTLKF